VIRNKKQFKQHHIVSESTVQYPCLIIQIAFLVRQMIVELECELVCKGKHNTEWDGCYNKVETKNNNCYVMRHLVQTNFRKDSGF